MSLGERGGWTRQVRRRARLLIDDVVGAVSRRTAVLQAHRERLLRFGLRLGAVVAVGGIAAGWLLWGSDVTRVEHVRVHVVDPRAPSSGAVLADASVPARVEQIRHAVAGSQHEPLVQVDIGTLTSEIEGLNRYSTVTVERSWPDALQITVTPRVAVLATVGRGSAVELLDGDGLAFETVAEAPPGIPLATLSGDLAEAGRAAVSAVLALSPQRRAQLQRIDVARNGTVSLDVGAVAVQWGARGEEALKSAVVDALVDLPGIERLDVSAPGRPVTVGGA